MKIMHFRIGMRFFILFFILFFETIETICFLCYSDSVYGIVFFMLARLRDNNDYRLEERIT